MADLHPNKATDLLTLQNVAVGYDTPNILTEVNLTVRSGERLALVGKNGVGKTSLLHAIMGFIPQLQGKINFDRKTIHDKKACEIARLGIGLVKQEHAVFADLSVTEHFTLTNKRSLDENLAYFPGLLPKAKQRACKLSGGQRQQLAIALALSNNPRLLLLDEPSANIQPSVVESMIETLKAINEEQGLTVIVAEQNLSVIGHLATHAKVIKAGKLSSEQLTINAGDIEALAAQLSDLEHAE